MLLMQYSIQLKTKGLFALIAVLLLPACSPPKKAVVEEREVFTVRQQSEVIGGQLVRIVQSGDTLYSIAFASQLDVNQLAAWNRISDSRRLHVGERIRLTKPVGFVEKPRAVNVNSKQVVLAESGVTREAEHATNGVIKSVPLVEPLANREPSANRQPSVKSASTTKQSGAQKIAKTQAVTRKPVPSQETVKSTAVKTNKKLTWVWPARGKVIRRFSSSSTQQGIDIQVAGSKQLVVASADGEVVYVGNSLKGYGNLVIVKHNDQFLSAYAHNDKIYVSEGQKIQQRQNIGSVGINNRRERALHFQVRRNGKSVDPLKYLPN